MGNRRSMATVDFLRVFLKLRCYDDHGKSNGGVSATHCYSPRPIRVARARELKAWLQHTRSSRYVSRIAEAVDDQRSSTCRFEVSFWRLVHETVYPYDLDHHATLVFSSENSS